MTTLNSRSCELTKLFIAESIWGHSSMGSFFPQGSSSNTHYVKTSWAHEIIKEAH